MRMNSRPGVTIPAQPFSFDEKLYNISNPYIPPIDFADKKASQYEAEAYTPEAERQNARSRLLDGATFWRNIGSPTDGTRAEANQLECATSEIDILLCKAAKGSILATTALSILADKILGGLYALSANEDKIAAGHWLGSLTKSISHFNSIAYSKPELFLEQSRCHFGIPGLISPSTEKTKSNVSLVDKLEVGKQFFFKLPKRGKGNKVRFTTPANLWAARLCGHIELTREQVRHFQSLPATQRPNLFLCDLNLAPWLGEAVQLDVFSEKSWENWFKVGWDIVMEATHNEPEKEPTLLALRPRKEKRTTPKGELTITSGTHQCAIREVLKKAFATLAGIQYPPPKSTDISPVDLCV